MTNQVDLFTGLPLLSNNNNFEEPAKQKQSSKYSRKELAAHNLKAFREIETILKNGNIEEQFKDRRGDYHSKEKFIVSWLGNYKGMKAEFSICKTDGFYSNYSGYAAIYTTQGFFHEHQFKGFPSIEMALLYIGQRLCPTRELVVFNNQYIKRYNERMNQQNKEVNND